MNLITLLDIIYFLSGSTMLNDEALEKKIEQNELAIQQLTLRVENLDRLANEMLEELDVSTEQINKFLNDKDNFCDENWEEILKQRKEFEAKLKKELDNIRNPLAAKKAFKDLRVERHWLFVR